MKLQFIYLFPRTIMYNKNEWHLINNIINQESVKESNRTSDGKILLLEQDATPQERELSRKKERAKQASIDAADAEIDAKETDVELLKKKRSSTKVDEDCPHTDGHDHNDDYCKLIRDQLQKTGGIIQAIRSMLPTDHDLPDEVKEKINSAMSSLSSAASYLKTAKPDVGSEQQAQQGGSEQQQQAPQTPQTSPIRRIMPYNVKPISLGAPRAAGFSFSPGSTPSYDN